MKVNIVNIPKAVVQFFVGACINAIIYFIFAPTQANLIGIFTTMFSGTASADTAGSPMAIMWIIIFFFCIIVNIGLPVWTVLDDDDHGGVEIT